MRNKGNFTWQGLFTLAAAILLAVGVHLSGYVNPAWMEAFKHWKAPASVTGEASLDSLVAATAALDTLDIVTDTFPVTPASMGELPRFAAALRRLQANKGKVRIAYFGDSMIEGDLVTQTIRHLLQQRFGGEGVGWVGMAPREPGFRRSIRQTYTPNWKSYSILRPSKTQAAAISGQSFRTGNAPVWTRLQGSNEFAETKSLNRIRVFYGPARVDSFEETIWIEQGEAIDTLDFSGNNRLNEWSTTATGSPFTLHIEGNAGRTWYGMSVEDWTGVYLDNFSLRGNTGLQMIYLPDTLLQDFQGMLGYDLVVLQYGLNLVDAGRTDFTGYEQALARVVNYLRRGLPGADFLIIGASDKATKLAGRMQTDPSIPYILAAQEKVARQTGCAYFNLFEAMGGEGTMINWADKKPVLANKDYTHPNFQGAEKLGHILYNFLLEACRLSPDSVTPPGPPASAPSLPQP